jgi:site-specific recombinase XerD
MSNTSIQLHIKASKTDPFRAGVHITLHANNSPLCPIKAIRPFLRNHPSKTGPLFVWHDGRHLTRSGLATVLKRICPQGTQNMSSHSFRIGAASTAAAAGHPRWLVQALGRWSSNCFRDYIRIPKTTLSQVSRSLATQTSLAITPFDPDNI